MPCVFVTGNTGNGFFDLFGNASFGGGKITGTAATAKTTASCTKRAIAVWAGGSTSQRNFIYFFTKTFFVLVIQRVVRFIAPFFHD